MALSSRSCWGSGRGLLVAIPEIGRHYVAFACVGLALLGRLTAQFVAALAVPPTRAWRINWNPVSEHAAHLKLAHGHLVCSARLLGISWMWFFGAVF